jgi:hypothetical protein
VDRAVRLGDAVGAGARRAATLRNPCSSGTSVGGG